jgi:hypothetical protein
VRTYFLGSTEGRGTGTLRAKKRRRVSTSSDVEREDRECYSGEDEEGRRRSSRKRRHPDFYHKDLSPNNDTVPLSRSTSSDPDSDLTHNAGREKEREERQQRKNEAQDQVARYHQHRGLLAGASFISFPSINSSSFIPRYPKCHVLVARQVR